MKAFLTSGLKWYPESFYYCYFAKNSEFVLILGELPYVKFDGGDFVLVCMQKQITNPHHKKPLE